jgi:hypothetical protein
MKFKLTTGTGFGPVLPACLGILLACALPGLAVSAELAVGVAVEHFEWKETPVDRPEFGETGYLMAASLSYLQSRHSGLVLGYRGKLWGGRVNYDGYTLEDNPANSVPLKTKTGYAGISNEFQLRWRRASEIERLDAVLGLGMDFWRRSLSTVQDEDFYVGFLRLGMESGARDLRKWSAALGIKYPVWRREIAYLDRLGKGYHSNPVLEPGQEVSAYANLGYRLAEDTLLVVYYDGFRFSKSASVPVQKTTGTTTEVKSFYQPASTFSVIGIKLEHLIQ